MVISLAYEGCMRSSVPRVRASTAPYCTCVLKHRLLVTSMVALVFISRLTAHGAAVVYIETGQALFQQKLSPLKSRGFIQRMKK